MEYCVYILWSEKLSRYYIGQTENIEERLVKHNTIDKDRNDFTQKGIPWNLCFTIDCKSREQAIKIERQIKKMKSKKYIDNLRKYPEMRARLLDKFT